MTGSTGFYARYGKRLFDIFFSAAFICIFWWMYVIVAAVVRVKLGSPVIFHQPRPGKIDPATGKETVFQLCKFRSMSDARDEKGELLRDELRLTSFGKLLRKTSLDELPEMINILKGDMSFVGPRPLLVEYIPWYTEEEHHRHDVLPGLTGLAQVNGRNALTWEQKFAYDLEYVRDISFRNDMRILFKTVEVVLKHDSVLSGDQQIQEKFDLYRSKTR